MSYRVSWINGPDGRVINTWRFDVRTDAERKLAEQAKWVAEDELLVFEVEGDANA